MPRWEGGSWNLAEGTSVCNAVLASRCSGLMARPPVMPSGEPGCSLSFQGEAGAEPSLGSQANSMEEAGVD